MTSTSCVPIRGFLWVLVDFCGFFVGFSQFLWVFVGFSWFFVGLVWKAWLVFSA